MGGEGESAPAGSTALDGNTTNAMGALNKVFVQQKFSLAEAATMGMCEVANKYIVINQDSGEKIFDVKEKGAGCNRCCCAPYHTFSLQFRPANADPESPPVMTVTRLGCCSKCLGCYACMGCCRDGMEVHAGYVDHEKIGELPRDSIIGFASVPTLGGWCTPTVHIMDGNGIEVTPFANVEGPTIFGGCTELCCDFAFPISKFTSEKKAGDIAVITKMKPKSFKDAAKEALGDSDMFGMEFKDPTLTPNQKATLLSSLFLLDFMFFERDNGMISCENGGIVCTLCMCYCCGVLNLCNIKFGGNGGEGGGN